MLLYLVRHGESLFNAEHRVQGQADVELSPLGLRQGEAIAAALSTKPIGAIFASPLRRAWQTAAPLAKALNLTVQADDRLKEIHAGIFQGLRWDEINARYPDEAVRWKRQEPDFIIPGGESRRALMARGRAALEAIQQTAHDQVVVVAHGGVLAAALKALLDVPAERNPFGFYNGSISKLRSDDNLKLLTLNELDHLRIAGCDREDRTGDL